MSEQHDPNSQDFSAGYDFNAGYDFGAGYGGGEEPVYGDEGPVEGASGDEAYAQGYDQAQAYDATQTYDQSQTYDQGYDQGQAYDQTYDQGYDQGQAYDQGYDQGQAYDQGYDPAQGYDDQAYGDYSQGYEQDEAAGYDEPAGYPADDLEEGAGAGSKRKPLMLAAAGLAVLLALGGAGYWLVSQNSDEGQASGGGFDVGSIMRMIPFLGPKDTDETIGVLQDNAGAVKKAIDAFARENGRLPATGPLVSAQLKKMKRTLTNPYKAEEPVLVEVAEVPSAPGAVAVTLHGQSYSVMVGDISGQPLAIEGTAFEVTGRLPKGGAKTAAKPPMAKPAKRLATIQKAEQAAAALAKAPQASDDAQAEAPAAGGAPDTAAVPTAPTGGKAGKADGKKPNDPLEGFIAEHGPKDAAPKTAVVPTAMLVKRNQEFDRWRSRGIALVYEARTAESIAAFKRALSLRPGDPSVTRWLQTIQGAIDKHNAEERERFEEDRKAAMPATPQAPPTPAVTPRPAPGQAQGGHGGDDVMKMYNELKKQDKVPLLAPPKVEP